MTPSTSRTVRPSWAVAPPHTTSTACTFTVGCPTLALRISDCTVAAARRVWARCLATHFGSEVVIHLVSTARTPLAVVATWSTSNRSSSTRCCTVHTAPASASSSPVCTSSASRPRQRTPCPSLVRKMTRGANTLVATAKPSATPGTTIVQEAHVDTKNEAATTTPRLRMRPARSRRLSTTKPRSSSRSC